ncbi:hypothetical protein Csa_019415 [Cucumis sativus]|uniref:Uncharacterized protein n=1 Tax=Cucumis sativus TaxID=3659 RepID=A0A0A0LKL4_CUCSA|nr:hypothetical protein Csa_019415 [Cucumis sativus]
MHSGCLRVASLQGRHLFFLQASDFSEEVSAPEIRFNRRSFSTAPRESDSSSSFSPYNIMFQIFKDCYWGSD